MKTTRRQRQQTWFAIMLAVAGVINLLFFLLLYRPARSEYYGLQQSIDNLRGEVQTRRQAVERFERLNAQLDTSEQDRLRLVTGHFIPYEAGFSRIIPQLDAMVQRAGVKWSQRTYDTAADPQYGLYSVKIRIPVQGSYANIVNFIKDLEEAQTFFIIESIDIQGATGQTQPAGSEISLAMSLETFFYQ